MKQYWDIKSQQADKIVLFRMGDFYEMFYKDAEMAAPILNIVLTSRNKKTDKETKMCGVPRHSLAGAVGKLLNAGCKVAICDQVEPGHLAKGLVKRKITRILTPGMVYDPDSLDQLSANYLCSLDENSVSFADLTTGIAFFYIVSSKEKQKQLIHLLNPAELVLSPKQKEKYFSNKEWKNYYQTVFNSVLNTGTDSKDPTNEVIEEQKNPNLPFSAQFLMKYIKSQQGWSYLKTLQPFQKKNFEKYMQMNFQTQEHLEIFKSCQGDKKNSLFYAVNRTKTPAGARLLKSRLQTPSCQRQEIEERLNKVEEWLKDSEKIKKAREILLQVGDIERRLGKISRINCHAQDLLALANSLKFSLSALSVHSAQPLPPAATKEIQELSQEITKALRQNTAQGIQPFQQTCVFNKGVSKELDQLIAESENKQSTLSRLEDQERIQTGIPSLKIRYNSVFGYYIEVTKANSKKVPAYYIRKQTLSHAERYTIEKLQIIEEQILSARARREALELKLFEELRQKAVKMFPDLFDLTQAVCEMDVNVSWAWLAIERAYVRPRFTSANQVVLVNNRHPVVEQKLTKFVPNTLRMKAGECLLLTGPNMAGKSTLMRQTALSAVLAQAGGFVPAEQALLPVFHKIFTRIGASDSLSQGLSTFMMEMKETVEILNNADENSLVILDEIGRGTATYDGMSLAQAILEYLVAKKKSLILFATHYHELTTLSQYLPQVRNAHMSVREEKGIVDFLYTLSSGASLQSYGIYTAKLAGFPKEVLSRAEILLKKRTALDKKPVVQCEPLGEENFLLIPPATPSRTEKR